MGFRHHVSPKLSLVLSICALVGSCDKCSTTTTNEGNFAIAASPTGCSIQAGASCSVTITVTRTGGFTGAVTLAAQGVPTGVTATFTPATVATGGTSATLALSVASSVPPAVHQFTIIGSASGITNKQVTMAVTITAAPVGGFTIALNPATLSVQQGQGATTSVTIARTAPFAGAVNLVLDGAPAGVTAAFNQTPIPAGSTTATATISVAASVVAGVYPLNVHGAASGGVTDQLAPLSLTVTAAPPPIQVALSCNTQTTPVWFGFQDGSGPWQQVIGVNGTYSVDITTDRGAVAYVRLVNSSTPTYDVSLLYATRAEFIEWAPLACQLSQPQKVLTGTVAGVSPGDFVAIAVGYSLTQIYPGGGTGFTLGHATSGVRDLVAGRLRNAVQPPDLIIRRGTDYPDGSVIPQLDFGGSEAFAAEQRTATIVGGGGETLNLWSDYITGNRTAGYLPTPPPPSAVALFPVVPAARGIAGDVYNLWAAANSADNSSRREVVNTFTTAADQTLTLGARLQEPTVFTLSAAPLYRVNIVTTLQSDYGSAFTGSYNQPDRTGDVMVTAGWLGGNAVNITTPDLTGVPGWLATYGPRPGVSTILYAKGTGITGSSGSLVPVWGNGVPVAGVVVRNGYLIKQIVP